MVGISENVPSKRQSTMERHNHHASRRVQAAETGRRGGRQTEERNRARGGAAVVREGRSRAGEFALREVG